MTFSHFDTHHFSSVSPIANMPQKITNFILTYTTLLSILRLALAVNEGGFLFHVGVKLLTSEYGNLPPTEAGIFVLTFNDKSSSNSREYAKHGDAEYPITVWHRDSADKSAFANFNMFIVLVGGEETEELLEIMEVLPVDAKIVIGLFDDYDDSDDIMSSESFQPFKQCVFLRLSNDGQESLKVEVWKREDPFTNITRYISVITTFICII